jgi:hypothetical protein
MSTFFGIDANSSSSFFDSFFGASGSSSLSEGLSLGDYAMIQSGSYKKLLTKYYKDKGNDSTTSGTGSTNTTINNSAEADGTKKLLTVKGEASSVSSAAMDLAQTDLDKTNREALLKKAKTFVNSYNSLVDEMDNVNSVAVLQNTLWMTNQTKVNQDLLDKVGISIGAKNDLAIDEEAFKKAATSDIKAVFSGSSSTVGQISARASQISALAGTQAMITSKSSYTNNGSYAISSNKLFNSLF